MSARSKPELPLKIIIDTNVFISAEDRGSQDDAHSPQAAEFIRLAHELKVAIVIASGTKSDMLQAPPQIRRQRQQELEKYVVLQPVPHNPDIAERAEFPDLLSSNNRADLQILDALHAGAADWLVTQDFPLRKRAARAGFRDQVFSLAEVIDTLKFYLNKPSVVPGIRTVKGYEIALDSSIFDDLRVDYPGFDQWWKKKVALEHRDVLVLGQPGTTEGLSVLKHETDKAYGLPRDTLKICTFKIDASYSGSRRGELLLKATIDYARRNSLEALYVEVLPDKRYFASWLESFGFQQQATSTTVRGEDVFIKRLHPDEGDQELPPLEHNIIHGPGSIRDQNPHLIPIQPKFHFRLFPEASIQRTLFSGDEASGNAIGKAYLSRATTRRLIPGDTLLFLRTGHGAAVTVIGVAESILASPEPEEIVSFVGNRTVYSVEEIRQFCHSGEVLAIRFRLDRVLSPPWAKEDLHANGVLRGNAQSIQRVRQGGIQWIVDRLGE